MRSSYRLFKIFGISVELHITFLLFMLLFLVGSLQQFIILLMVFSIVLLHELCHSLVALYYGIKVPKIILTPIGGLANIELPENPKKEFLISIAGPLSNFVLIFVGVALALLMGVSYDQIVTGFSGDVNLSQPSSILGYFIFINFILGAFNILPGFPMDGGRVFRAVLAFKYDYIKATEIAVKVGQVVAILVILLAFYTQNILTAVIGVFLLLSGGQELQVLKIKHALSGMRLGAIAALDMRYVYEGASLKDFMDMVAVPGQDHYPVTDQTGKIVSILSMSRLGDIKAGDPSRVLVKDVAGGPVDYAEAGLLVDDLLSSLLSREFVLVVDSGRVVGYLTPGRLIDIARFYGLRGGP